MTPARFRRARVPAALALAAACGGPAPGAPVERVIVPPRATVHAIADSLRAHRIIASPLWFRLVARLTGSTRMLRSGPYDLPRGAGTLAALDALREGRVVLVRLTVPEGSTLMDIAGIVERDLAIPRDSFLLAARDSALLREYGVTASSFEGFLRPDTYRLAPGVSARFVVTTMASIFRNSWDPAWDERAAAQGLDRVTVVTLASLVEGEAKVDDDRPLIAAVYRNRLRLHMPLQADPTVQYAIQLATGERKPRLFEKDYGFPSPWNTYLHPGLPPTPVGAPGSKSIAAVLDPAPVPYLYFVAGPDGRHIFSRTLAEHMRNVRRVQHRP